MQSFNPKDIFAGRYRLLKRIAQDTFSESWLAGNELMAGNKQVLKIYNSLEERGGKAFRREFERAYHLTHARLVRVTDFDVHNGRPYLLLPYFRRGSTARLVGKLSEKEIARIMRDVAGALAFIHQPAYNIVHRDVRPDNILLDDAGNYMLSIFGIGKALQEEFHEKASQDDTAISSDTGGELQAYQAPEYFTGHVVAASDVWALGATLFELATGGLPFGRPGGEGQLSGQPAPGLPSRFSKNLSLILKKCLAKAPGARPSAESLREMAMAYLDTGEWPVLPSKENHQSRATGRRAEMWKPSYLRIRSALASRRKGIRKGSYNRAGAVLLAALLLMAGLAVIRPKWDAGKGFALNSSVLPDTALHQPLNQKPSLKEKEPAEADVEKKAVNNPFPDSPPESFNDEGLPENIYAFPPLASRQTEARQPSQEQPEPPALENKKSRPEPAPPSAKTMEKGRKKEQPPKPGSRTEAPRPAPEAESEEQPIRPRLNGLTSKWGYVDKSGTWMIWPQFEEATSFKDGKARVVKKVGNDVLKSYYLDTNGFLTPITETGEADNN